MSCAVVQDGAEQRKKNGKTGAAGLSWLGTSAGQRVASADTQDASACPSKGPTVMEVRLLHKHHESLCRCCISSHMLPQP